MWFENMGGNSALKNDSHIKTTFLDGGYFRYDVNDQISVLVLDTMYYMIDNDQKSEGSTPNTQFDWLNLQLELAKGSSKKFIISFHVYAGARYKYDDQWTTSMTSQYFKILRDHAD